MDYGEMLAEHVNVQADFTVACLKVRTADAAGQLGVMEADSSGRVFSFMEKPEQPKPLADDPTKALASMGIYIVAFDYLARRLREDAEDETSSHDFGRDVIPKVLADGDHLQAHQFVNPHAGRSPYWRDVGTLDAYYQAHLELISAEPPLDLYDLSWPTLTYQQQLPPAHFVDGAEIQGIEGSMVSGGCVVTGSRLRNSILFSNVKVHTDCELDGVLALPGCEIGRGSRLKNVILDNQCQVPEGLVIGEDPALDAERYVITEDGIVVVNRRLLGQADRYIPGVVMQNPND